MTQVLVSPAETGDKWAEPMAIGLLGIPPLAFEPIALVSAVPSTESGVLHELKALSLVLAVAIAVGALVAAIGIVLTV